MNCGNHQENNLIKNCKNSKNQKKIAACEQTTTIEKNERLLEHCVFSLR